VLAAGCGQANSDNVNVQQIVQEDTSNAENAEDSKEQAAAQDDAAADAQASDTTQVDASDSQGAPRVSAGEIVTLGEDGARLQAGMVTDAIGINDHSFYQSAWEGFTMLNESIGARVSYAMTGEEFKAEDAFEKLAVHNDQIIWGVGYEFADALLDAAAKHPELHYAIVDHVYDQIPQNVTCARFRSEEPSFLAGYIAASVSETGKVGYIGGMDVDAIAPFQYGYLAGVAKADSVTGKKTEVEVAFLESFEDPAGGKSKALSMYENGCDVIFHAAGGSGDGVIDAAKESGKYVIGVDCDQSYLAPENVLTSVIKKVNVVVSNISVQYSIQDNIGGKSLEYGIAEYAMGLPTDHPNYSDALYEEVMSLQDEIISHLIEVPDSEAELADYLEELKE
nr:BMP family ABC transporter substrate-binding protein [Lachnospiraceae bacterium]